MGWKDISNAVAQFAPLLGSVVGGPAGAGVGNIIASALGVENKPDQILAAIQTNPDAAVKLKQLEFDNKSDLEKLQIEKTKAELADKQDARSNHKHSLMPSVLSCVLSLVIVGIIYLLFYSEPPEGSRDVLFMVLGVVIKEWGGAMQYWFGTTRSSQEKSKLLKG
jgi:hypothetical protein